MIDFSEANFLVVGLARNCQAYLKNDVTKINNAFSNSNSVQWLIIESDSTDETLKTLEKLKENFNLDYLSLGKLESRYSSRTERIASCRNEYLRQIRCNPTYKKIDYVVVADLDGANTNLKPHSVEQCWNLDEKWDACFANQSAPYYDIWALRHRLWSPYDCFEHEKFLKKNGVGEFKSRFISVYSKMIKIPKNAKPIKVNSAFGGLGIYKRIFFDEGIYEGLDKDGNEVCEHVFFHTERKGSKNLFIVPSLINSSYNEHSRQSKPLNLLILFITSRFMSFKTMSKIKYAVRKNFKRLSSLVKK